MGRAGILLLFVACLPARAGAASVCDREVSGHPEVTQLASRVRKAVPPPEVLEIARALDETTVGCPGRIWPEGSVAPRSVLLVDSTARRAWIWKRGARAGELSPVPWRRIAGNAELQAPYSFPEWEGARITAVNLALHRTAGGRLDWRHPFRFAVHESFHRFEQLGTDTWPFPPPPEGSEISWSERARRIPSNPEPRYLRSMMLRALREAYLDPARRETLLNEAAHWRSRYEHEFPDEAARLARTDLLESSARAVEILSLAVAEEGCGASEDALRGRIVEMLRESTYSDALRLFNDDAEPQSESYDLAAAWLIAREAEGGAWAARAGAAAHPADWLLAGRPAAFPAEDHGRRAIIARWERSADEDALPFVESAAAAYGSSDTVRIAFPRAASQGSFASWGFFVSDRLPGSVLSRELIREMREGPSRVEVSVDYRAGAEPVPMLYRLSTPCADGVEQVVFLVPRSALRERNGTWEFRAPGMEGSVRGERDAHPGGLEWICPARTSP